MSSGILSSIILTEAGRLIKKMQLLWSENISAGLLTERLEKQLQKGQ